MQGKKPNQNGRKSTAKKSQFSKKNINQKDKIVNAIKRSALQTSHINKPRISSKTKHPQTEKKTHTNLYQLQSYRYRPHKSINSVSKSMTVRNQKPKTLQFPFQAIKFKQKQANQSKQHNANTGLCIQYDEPEETQINLYVTNNSKRIVGAYNQRVGRYSELKFKTKENLINQVRNIDFISALVKLFKFLDPHCKGTISHAEIDYRKLPQGVLYFLGGLFQRIRQRNLVLFQNQFLDECSMLYKRSSNDDVNWFIEEITTLISSSSQNFQKKNELKTGSNAQFGIINNECLKKIKIGPNTNTNSFPINQKDYNSKQSNPSQKDSVKSAHFGQFDHRFSFHPDDRKQIDIQTSIEPLPSLQNTQHLLSQKQQRISFSQEGKQIPTIRTVGIKKNIVTKAEDIREQIYAKMDQLKMDTENKQNSLLKENFMSKSYLPPQNSSSQKQNVKKPLQTDNYRDFAKTLTIKQKRVIDSFLPKEQNILEQKDYNKASVVDEKMYSSKKSSIREPLLEKSSGWMNKTKNCQGAFDELQKMREQFRVQKKSIEKREIARYEKTNRLMQEFILEDETRVLKLTEKKLISSRPQQRQTFKYERNIDRLSSLTSSRNQNSRSINIHDSLVNSCRKSLQVSLPVKYEGQKTVSFSDKKSIHQKTDKIEELSQKLEKYLKNNAQKIQYSKNFTETPISVGYNKILAM